MDQKDLRLKNVEKSRRLTYWMLKLNILLPVHFITASSLPNVKFEVPVRYQIL